MSTIKLCRHNLEMVCILLRSLLLLRSFTFRSLDARFDSPNRLLWALVFLDDDSSPPLRSATLNPPPEAFLGSDSYKLSCSGPSSSSPSPPSTVLITPALALFISIVSSTLLALAMLI
uniref:(northern house mosquito) hypothetical protein n=1 Tax=Culex pipiens TaxID=7175 RepID=A0A8D8CSS5_CULPI